MPDAAASPFARLAELVAGTSAGDVAPGTGKRVAEHVLDTIAAGLAAVPEPPGQALIGLFPFDSSNRGSRILGIGTKVSPADAAWVNGSLSHLLDFDDVGFTHPGTCLVPALLAVGEQRNSSGAELITALTVGYETFARIYEAFEPYDGTMRARGIHPMTVCGSVASALATGKLLGLPADQLMVAMAIAASSSFGLMEHFGTWAKGLQAGNAARAGVTSALLAERGFYASRSAVDGRRGMLSALLGEGNYDLAALCADWAVKWAVDDPGVSLKPYPACGAAQRPISASITFHQERAAAGPRIERVEVSVTEALLESASVDWPARGFEGRFSMRYCVAAGLVDGQVNLETFSDAALARPDLQDMMRRITIIRLPGGYGAGPDMEYRLRTPIRLVFADHSETTVEEFNPPGSTTNRLPHAAVVGKYVSCASRVLPQRQVDRSVAVLEDLAARSVSELVDSLVAGGSQAGG